MVREERLLSSQVAQSVASNLTLMRKLIAVIILCVTMTGSHAQFISNTGIQISNSAALITNGDWNNAAGSKILNNGVISTNSAFINNGTLDVGSRGGFVLDFPTDLNFQPGGPNMGFLTKKGVGRVLLTGSISVGDSLVLEKGVIRLVNSIDTVALAERAQLISKDTFFIENGFIARSGIGDMVFPTGMDGLYMPLKIYKVNAKKLTVAIEHETLTRTAGPGVDAMISFPYAWRVIKKLPTDTAAYVEVNYPLAMHTVTNPIIVREIPGQQYASMGARIIDAAGPRVIVKSYSRRANGLFTVAQGFPSDPVTDSLALVSLYESTGGDQWTNKANWLTGNVETWFGVTVTGQSITAVELPANNLVGPVADPLVDILSLQTVNLSANGLTSIPDFTLNPEVSSLNVSDNNLDFASLEPNAPVPGINYLIQGDIGAPIDTAIAVGSPYSFSIPTQGTSSQYLWKRNGSAVAGATNATFQLPAISRESMGEYIVEVTNPSLPGLLLKSSAQKVLAYANVGGKLYADVDVPATAGELTLFRVQPGAFAPVQTIAVGSDGAYTFPKVVLDDYQIRGFADTLVYERAIPTYYKNTIFWEEADTLRLENTIDTLDIVSQVEPGPPSGRGSISGFLQEDDGTGRIDGVEKNRRVARAGVSARRVQRTGRTKGEILTLVAYVFTDENGEFNLPNLPEGEYRLNFQYPGYPMDENSYTTITIGPALESQVSVEANVLNGKINVRKLIITGIYEAENYHVQVFPNPAVEYVHLKFAGEVDSRMINVSNLQGQTMYTADAHAREMTVNVSHLPQGIYLLNISERGRKVKTLKISIE